MTNRGGIGEPWALHADLLAAWTVARLVNRTDVWGGYYRNNEGTVGPMTCPGRRDRGRVRLTGAVLRRHYAATDCGEVIGLHSGSPGPDSTARWVAGDFDVHSDDDEPEFVQRTAFHVFDVLSAIGYHPLLT